MSTKLLQQDDAAPDSYQTFSQDFVNLTGQTIEEFKASAVYNFDGMCIGYTSPTLLLSCCADDPFWVLYNHKQ